MDLLIGLILGLLSIAIARSVGLDRERGFFPVLLFMIASYYILFAVMVNSLASLWPETISFLIFGALSLVGYKRTLWLVVMGLVGHGFFDLFHHAIISNPGVPQFWPWFCSVADFVLGAYLAILLVRHRLAAVERRDAAVV